MNFLRPFVFHLYTEDSNLNFQFLHWKSFQNEAQKRFSNNLTPNSTKKFIFQKWKFTLPFSLHLVYTLKPAYKNGSRRIYGHLKQYYLLTPKIFLIEFWSLHRMSYFYWLCIFSFWLYYNHRFSAVSTVVKCFWRSIEWQIPGNL